MTQDAPFHFELSPPSFAELSSKLRDAGHGALIGEDGVIRLGLARIRRRRPPLIDDNGAAPPAIAPPDPTHDYR
jgi:hypothetical protein